MTYTHILVAIDLSPDSKILIDKAISIARPYNSKISLIHVDINYSDCYMGIIDVNFSEMQKHISEETQHTMELLVKNISYPITDIFNSIGNLSQVLINTINAHHIDLLLCGHHKDFWSKLLSSARQLINTVHVDTLIIPLGRNK